MLVEHNDQHRTRSTRLRVSPLLTMAFCLYMLVVLHLNWRFTQAIEHERHRKKSPGDGLSLTVSARSVHGQSNAVQHRLGRSDRRANLENLLSCALPREFDKHPRFYEIVLFAMHRTNTSTSPKRTVRSPFERTNVCGCRCSHSSRIPARPSRAAPKPSTPATTIVCKLSM